MEILFNWDGLRVYLKETQGLFSKTTRPKGYALFSAVGSRSDGLDLKGLGSNLGRPSDIGRPGRFGRVGAAALNAGGSVLRWRGLQLAGDGEKGSAGRDSLGFESGTTRAERVIHLRHRRGSGKTRRHGYGGGGGSIGCARRRT